MAIFRAPPGPRMDAAPASRVANLDLLRAIAIALVVPVNLVGERVIDVGPTMNHVFESGWVGVDLFFVLSGWLIGGLYWRELGRHGDVEVGRFWARRWLRTMRAERRTPRRCSPTPSPWCTRTCRSPSKA